MASHGSGSPGGTYPWGSIRSTKVDPFSFPTNGLLSLQFKGDSTLAPVADAGTSFWISFYDTEGRATNFIVPNSVVTNSDWSLLEADLADFGDTSLVDIGNLAQWRILVQGWEGTAESPAQSVTFYVDNIQISEANEGAPSLSIAREGANLVISWPGSATGFILESSSTVVGASWEAVAGVQNNQATITTSNAVRFFRLKK
ncbi:MAG: hypothetical protein ACO1QB_13350 [Verrucomicrobiales bacterium]